MMDLPLPDAAVDWLGRQMFRRPVKTLYAPYLSRRFPPFSQLRVWVYYTSNIVSFSQVFPLIYSDKAFKSAYGAEIRAAPVEELINHSKTIDAEADVIFIQFWFSFDPAIVRKTLERIKSKNPDAKIIFLDPFSHSDIRMSKTIIDYIDGYVKKFRLIDTAQYFQSFNGGTTVTDFYSKLYDIEIPVEDWRIPHDILPILRVGPGFITSPGLMRSFLTSSPPRSDDRSIDVHARLESKGEGWYGRMRRHGLSTLHSMEDLRILKSGRVKWREYMDELRQSKICFSPFGYGEQCWRDIEAILTGSVLVKPDMSHIETLPNLYESGVTYAPIRWDFGDLPDVIRDLLADRDRREYLTTNAYNRVVEFLSSGGVQEFYGQFLRS